MGLAAVVLAGGITLSWLDAEDPLRPCVAIAVMNGDQPARADTAARIARSGIAPEIWLTNDPRSGGGGLGDAGTASNIRRLVSQGVSAGALRILEGHADGTRAELTVIRDATMQRSAACVIVVTSPAHAARVKVTWRRVPEPRPQLIVRHAAGPGYAGRQVRARELMLLLPALVGRPW